MKLTEFLVNIGRPVAYYPSLVKLTGSVGSAIFLCQLLYWSGKQADPDGWIYKTQAEITEETGLTRYEQEYARKILKEKELLFEKFGGIPRKLYFRLSIDRINELWLQVQNLPLSDEENSEKDLKNHHNAVELREGDEKSLKYQHIAEKPHYIMDNTVTCNSAENQQANTEITTDNKTKNIYSLSDGEKISSPAHNSAKPTKSLQEKDDMTPSLFGFLGEKRLSRGKSNRKTKSGSEEQNSVTKELLLYFAKEYKDYFGNPYNINWGKEMKLFSLLLKRYDPERIKKAVKWYFRMKDDFFYANGYSVGIFYQKFNAILLSGKSSLSEIIDRVFEEQERRSKQCSQEQVL